MEVPSGCTAAAIATKSPEYRTATESVSDALAWLQSKEYDSAPVYEDGQPIGYVTPELLTDADENSTLKEACRPLTIDVIIGSDADFETVVEALCERPFYYLADRDRVTGVLTRADLNTEPVYSHLFTAISRLEHAFREAILTHAPDWEENAPIGNDRMKRIKDRHADAAAANIALDPIHYVQFSGLVDIISADEMCRDAFRLGDRKQAQSQLSEIVELRNDVAHATPVIQNTDTGVLESGRTVLNLQDQYACIQTLLHANSE